MYAIKGGLVHTMNGSAQKDAIILVEGTKIKAVGTGLTIPSRAQVIDAGECVITPGLIDAHTHIGLKGEARPEPEDDVNEMTDPITPHIRVMDALNPQDLAFPEVLSWGVTTVMVAPGSANLVGGQCVVVKTRGATIEEMILKQPAGMKMALGENPKRVYGGRKTFPSTRLGNAGMLRETLVKAQNYAHKLKKAKKGEPVERDLKLEPLVEVLERKLKAKIHAHAANDIMTALRIAAEFNLDITIEHGTSAPRVAQHLAERGVPVIIGPLLFPRGKVETAERSFATAAQLVEAGVLIAISTDATSQIRFLALNAGLAVREGLDEIEGLKAITINPARILGVDDRVGSLEAGKDADLVIFSGHPLQTLSRTELVMVDGEIRFSGGRLAPEVRP